MLLKNILKALLAPIGKGLLIFAVFGAALAAYAAVTFPGDDPDVPSGVLGVYTTSTGAPLLDGGRGSYASANGECPVGSHVCTVNEMINTYAHVPLTKIPDSGTVWVNNGPTFSGARIANDCAGWTSAAGTSLASVWTFQTNTGYSGISSCAVDREFACCK